jgi:hypothetical protein
MATRVSRTADFLKGFLLGLWIGITDPFGTRYGKKGEKLLRRMRASDQRLATSLQENDNRQRR